MLISFWVVSWYRATTGITDGLMAVATALIIIWYLGQIASRSVFACQRWGDGSCEGRSFFLSAHQT